MKLSHISLAVLSAIALAACGGSGSSNQVTAGNGGNDDKKDEPKAPVTASLDFAAKVTGLNKADVAVNGGKSTEVMTITAADDEQYIPNPKLLDKDGKSKAEGAALNGNVVKNVYTKAKDGTFVEVELDGTNKTLYAKGDTKKTALKADELYQMVYANNGDTFVTALEAFGTSAAISDEESLPKEFSLAKLEAGMSKGDINFAYTTQAKQLGPKGADNANVAQTTFIQNADSKDQYISTSGKRKLGSYKAYKQNVSAVALVANKAGDLNNLYFTDNGAKVANGIASTGVLVAGETTLSLPENVKASYAGKAFTQKSEGDLALNVEFGKYGATRFDGTITRKDLSTDKALATYKIASQDEDGVEFSLDVTGSANMEYDKLQGAFYGSNAEEVAGALVDNGSNKAVGAFAAQKK